MPEISVVDGVQFDLRLNLTDESNLFRLIKYDIPKTKSKAFLIAICFAWVSYQANLLHLTTSYEAVVVVVDVLSKSLCQP